MLTDKDAVLIYDSLKMALLENAEAMILVKQSTEVIEKLIDELKLNPSSKEAVNVL